MHLQKNTTSAARRNAGRLIVALLAGATVFGTVSARAGSGEDYEIAVKFAEGAGNTSAKVRVKAGEEFALRWNQPGQSWKGQFTVTRALGDSVMVKMNVTPDNGKPVAPSLMLRLGESGSVRSDGEAGKGAFQIGLTVTAAAGA